MFELLFSAKGSINRWKYFVGTYLELPTITFLLSLLGFALAFWIKGGILEEYESINAITTSFKQNSIILYNLLDFPTMIFFVFFGIAYICALWSMICLGSKRLRDLKLPVWLIIIPTIAKLPIVLFLHIQYLPAMHVIIIFAFEFMFLCCKSRST